MSQESRSLAITDPLTASCPCTAATRETRDAIVSAGDHSLSRLRLGATAAGVTHDPELVAAAGMFFERE
jgi:hypothetical protein